MRFSSAIGGGAASSFGAGTSASFAAGRPGALGGGTFDAGSWARHATPTVRNSAQRFVGIARRNTQYITQRRLVTAVSTVFYITYMRILIVLALLMVCVGCGQGSDLSLIHISEPTRPY